jgi:hypothetical membrane protein
MKRGSNQVDEMGMDRRVSAGAICWLLTAEVFLTQFAAQAAAIDYHFLDEDISVLGATSCGLVKDPITGLPQQVCSPLHLILNGGFVVMGLLILSGLILTRSVWQRGRTGYAGFLLLATASIGTMLAGLFPFDRNLAMHVLGSLLFFFLAPLAMVLLGVSILKRAPGLTVFSWLIGAVTLAAFCAYPHYAAIGLPRGVMERIAAYPSSLWFIIAGIYILTGRLGTAPANSSMVQRL